MNSQASAPADPPKDPPKAGEADYLQQQADDARSAITAAFADAKDALSQGMDAGEWTRRYPMVAIGSAVAAGFVAAVLAIPSRQQQELKKLEKIRRALHPEPPKPVAAAENIEDKADAPRDAGKASFWSTLLRECVSLIRPVLVSAVTASISAKGAAEAVVENDPSNKSGRTPASNREHL